MLANRINWTVDAASWTVSVDLHSATGSVGISNVVWWTFTDWAAVSRFAHCRRMTDVRIACFDWRTLDISDRVRSEANGTLAARLVIFRYANSVIAASVFHAGIVTFILQSITELGWWAVVVVNARNLLATFNEIVWIAGERSWWTLALREVIIRNTHGERTALDAITCRCALEVSLLFDAHFGLWALCVRRAFVGSFDPTTGAIIRIANVAWQTLTTTFVIVSNTRRVRRTIEFGTNGDAFENSENVLTAGSDSVAFLISGAFGYGRLFTCR